jgi:outer membrane lipase/esterase
MFQFLRARRRALGIAAASAFSLLLASCGGGSVGEPPLFGTTVVFGASLNDTGNLCIARPSSCPPTPPYAAGKFSNGPLWVETVAAKYGASATASLKGGTNYAYAGARTGTVPGITTPAAVPSMVTQLGQYLAKVNFQASPQALYIVDAGNVGNNITDALTLAQTNPNAPVQVLTAAVGDIVNMVLTLYSAGARHIVVTNAPDVGKTPQAQALGAAAAAGATQLSFQFNGALAQQLTGLKAASSGLNLYTVDIGALNAQLIGNPASFGLTNVTQACFNTLASPPTLCPTPDTYLYWDPFHPTAAAHAIIAQQVIAAIGR